MATARFTIYVAPARGRPGHPLSAGTAVEEGARFGWRLLAANNREVARSSIIFADVARCVAAITVLRSEADAGVLTSARGGRADWTWRLRIAGADVAISSRTYQRRRQCEAAGALFLALVMDAEVAGPIGPDGPGALASDAGGGTAGGREAGGFDTSTATSAA